MRRAWAFLCILFWAVWIVPVYAQESEIPDEEPDYEEDVPIESDWTGYMPSLYSRGDQLFIISVGVTIPTVFTNTSGDILFSGVGKLLVGGAGSLSYNYFLGSHVFVGGEIQGMFAGTLGKHMLYIIPITARAGYQFVYKRFEFPIALGLGIAPQLFNTDYNYAGFVIKPTLSAYFRFNPDWSFGINTAWWWLPQITEDPAKSVHGNFFEASLSARYHF
ncbi:hypothetical protein FACS189479_09690 [Spirochaetia bacterium]|nr:hypothetical protein FACS189479_09690 [Spirochaetia bacterium]